MAVTHQRATSGTASLGADLTVDLTSDAVGDLAYVLCRCTGATGPTVPAGWTTLASDTNGSMVRVLAVRQKQTGDTTFQFVIPGTANSAYTLDVWRGGVHSQVSAATNQAASGTAVAYDPLTMTAGAASFCVATWTNANGSIIAQSGYTSGVSGSQIHTTYKLAVTAGSLDPPDATLSSGSSQNRIGWHIEIRDTNVSGTLSISGGGTVNASGQKTAQAAVPISGAGTIAAAGQKSAAAPVAVSGGGSIQASATKTAAAPAALSGGGAIAATGQKAAAAPAAVSGGGSIQASAVKAAGGPVGVSGGGLVSATGAKTALRAITVTGGGDLAATAIKTANATVTVTGGGDLVFIGVQQTPAGGPLRISGGGGLQVTGRKTSATPVAVTGGGNLAAQGAKTARGELALTGGGHVRFVGQGPVAGVVGRLLLSPAASGELSAEAVVQSVMQLGPVVEGEISRSDA